MAIVEITSEEKDYPVEAAFVSGETPGWRAAELGPQTIRLVFDQPQTLKRISLVFEEKETGRTKSSSYVGLPMAGARFRKLFASSGFSALLRQYAKSKNIKLSCQTSPYSNWQLCRIRVVEVLAPLSRVCACFDSRLCFCFFSYLKRTARPRVLAPGSSLTSVREVERFPPGSLWAPW